MIRETGIMNYDGTRLTYDDQTGEWGNDKTHQPPDKSVNDLNMVHYSPIETNTGCLLWVVLALGVGVGALLC